MPLDASVAVRERPDVFGSVVTQLVTQPQVRVDGSRTAVTELC
jgi:hypothetical protein